MTESRLYYESHVTVEAGEYWDQFAAMVRELDWRASKFDEDEVDDMSGKWFISARGRDLSEVKWRMGQILDILEELGYEVLRWKIEDTVLDSKHGDERKELVNG
jgi:hypothetical protein